MHWTIFGYNDRSPMVKTPKPKHIPLRSRVIRTAEANGHLLQDIKSGRPVRCTKCKLEGGLRKGMTVFSKPCTGPTYGAGHDVRNVHGLQICWKCGAYTATGIIKGKLDKPCLNHPTATSVTTLSRVQDDLLPHGFNTWPDGTSQRETAKGHKRKRNTFTNHGHKRPRRSEES